MNRRYTRGLYISHPRSAEVHQNSGDPGKERSSVINQAGLRSLTSEVITEKIFPHALSRTADDSIILLNGARICAKLISIGVYDIEYRQCRDTSVQTIRREEVHMLVLSNGTTELITEQQPVDRRTSMRLANGRDTTKIKEAKKAAGTTIFTGILSIVLSSLAPLISPVFLIGGLLFAIIALFAGGRAFKLMNRNSYFDHKTAFRIIVGLMMALPILVWIGVIAAGVSQFD
jgi:hypothetical protein